MALHAYFDQLDTWHGRLARVYAKVIFALGCNHALCRPKKATMKLNYSLGRTSLKKSHPKCCGPLHSRRENGPKRRTEQLLHQFNGSTFMRVVLGEKLDILCCPFRTLGSLPSGVIIVHMFFVGHVACFTIRSIASPWRGGLMRCGTLLSRMSRWKCSRSFSTWLTRAFKTRASSAPTWTTSFVTCRM